MKAPNFDHVWETFIRIPPEAEEDWQLYTSELRKLDGIIRTLKAKGKIVWWCFLVHDITSGVPEEGVGFYFHLRMELVERLQWPNLPPQCVMTRRMKEPKDLDMCDVSAFRNYKEGWALMGEASEWVVHFVRLHTSGIPVWNAAQLVHYTDNMMQLEMIQRTLTQRLIRSRIFRLLDRLWKRVCS